MKSLAADFYFRLFIFVVLAGGNGGILVQTKRKRDVTRGGLANAPS